VNETKTTLNHENKNSCKSFIAQSDLVDPTQIVSAADKLHNLRAILMDYRTEHDKLWSRFNGGKEGTFWYYATLLEAFSGGKRLSPLLAELDRTLTTLEALANNGRRVEQPPRLPTS
jgi:hypothetical protein